MMTDLKSAQLDALVLKSLLGEDVVDIKFYLFSSRSKHDRRVFRPRALYANSKLLSENSTFLADLLKGQISLAHNAMFGFRHRYPKVILHDAYGYEDDSDLEESEEVEEEESATWFQVGSDTNTSARASDKLARATSEDNDECALDRKPIRNRCILVKNTAFRTWKSLLFYFYTGRIQFTFLKSTRPLRFEGSTGNIQAIPTCSAKSMYRLASKMGLEALQTKALDYIPSVLSNLNIVTELESPLLASYPPVFNVVLETLFRHIDSPPVRSALPQLFERIAQGELQHGADILKELYEKIMAKHYAALNPALPSLPKTPNTAFTFSATPSFTFSSNSKRTKLEEAAPK